jgi:hypothetical protein
LRAAIEALIDRARKLVPAPDGLVGLERFYRANIEQGKPDRYVLREFESRISSLIEAPAEDQMLDAYVTTLERWAGLPGFLHSIEPRLNRSTTSASGHRFKILTQYVNRTYPSVPRRSGRGALFDRHRDALASAIQEKVSGGARNRAGPVDVVNDIAAFADILLFHQAYRAISEVLPSLSRVNAPDADIRRLQDGLAHWPRGAAQTWDHATTVLRSHLNSGSDRLDALVSPPLLPPLGAWEQAPRPAL